MIWPYKLWAFVAGMLLTQPLIANGFNHTLVATTDYLSDGVSQTKGKSAWQLQSIATLKSEEGDAENYTTILLSNLQFEDEKGYEFDLGFGTRFEADDVKFDLGLLNNFNVSFDNVDDYFWEIYLGILTTDNTAIYFGYADDVETFDGGKNAKISWDHKFHVMPDLTLSYQIGYADMYRSRLSNSDYAWIRLGLTYQINEIELALDFHDTDIKQVNDFNDIAQATLTLTVKVNL